MSEASKASWAAGNFAELITEEYRRKVSEGTKKSWARGDHDSKETRRLNSEATKAAWARGAYDDMATPAVRQQRAGAMKAAWARGDFDNVFNSEEYRLKVSANLRMRWARGDFDTEDYRRGCSERTRAQWVRGDFDGVFTSPSKPELAIAQELDNRGREYQTQYRLEGDGRPFDFLIGDDLLLEVDGHYFHDDKYFPGIAARDAAKSALAEERGYRLIRVTDLEIAERGAAAILESIQEATS